MPLSKQCLGMVTKQPISSENRKNTASCITTSYLRCSTAPVFLTISQGVAEIRGVSLSLRLLWVQSAVLVLYGFVFFSRCHSGMRSAFSNWINSSNFMRFSRSVLKNPPQGQAAVTPAFDPPGTSESPGFRGSPAAGRVLPNIVFLQNAPSFFYRAAPWW